MRVTHRAKLKLSLSTLPEAGTIGAENRRSVAVLAFDSP